MNKGSITYINGPVVKGTNMEDFQMREMVYVGERKLIAEVIGLEGDVGTVQVYEETEGMGLNEKINGLGAPLSLKLGPGLVGNILDGIGRPLKKINEVHPDFIPEGVGLISIDMEKSWPVVITVSDGDSVLPGQTFGLVQESSLIQHRLMIPPGVAGIVSALSPNGEYMPDKVLIKVQGENGGVHEITMVQDWPVRRVRPVRNRLKTEEPLVTGQRVFDTFFPIAKGGTAAIPGGFGTGKTMTQHQLAKWSDADLIVYIGCGERGNEMTNVLEEFPSLIDPKSGQAIMERTVLIANTSNMPVAAREASIYTGISIAEYYRDMGYHVAVMADSTSRWAEALREISGRLEEMPAEEGYPAYLPHRLAEFYERAGYVETLQNGKGSITIIGAISPAGGDFSEPVTENTMRYVNAFLALDRKLAYARHYPAINWLNSYSGYLKVMKDWYEENVAEDFIQLRNNLMKLLQEESKLLDLVQLVGEDVLPDSQRLVLDIARIVKVGILQQNAFHKEDAFVPLNKQYAMIKVVWHLYLQMKRCIDRGIPLSKTQNHALSQRVAKMKYDISNENLDAVYQLSAEIEAYYEKLMTQYK